MLRRLGLALLLLVLFAGIQVSPAVAERFHHFNLKGSNGYRLFVEAQPPAGKQQRGRVTIDVLRGVELAIYSVPARVTESRIVAKLGSLGEINLRFHPGGRGVTRPRCGRDYPIDYEKGFYAGRVAFHGEGGFTEAGARRVRLSLHPFIDRFYCSLSVEEELDPESPGARLLAVSGSNYLRAIQNAPGEELKLHAIRSERRGQIRIYRVVQATYPGTAFEFDLSTQTAELHPSAPFSGLGLYRGSAGKEEQWTGDLTVDFPGRSDVPLAGPQFVVGLDPARWTEEPPEFERPNLQSAKRDETAG